MSSTMEKVKEFASEHKTELVIAGVGLVVIGGVVFVASRRIGSLKELCAIKDLQIQDLSRKCDIKSIQIDQLLAREKELMERCRVKDMFFDELMSDALRNGSSLGGRHMAEKKAMINEILKAAA